MRPETGDYTPSEVAHNPICNQSALEMRFHPYGWAAGLWELKTPLRG